MCATCVSEGKKEIMPGLWSGDGGMTATVCVVSTTDVPKKETKKKKDNTVNLKALGSVVLSSSARRDIVATLLQHQNNDLIMEEWGLGDTVKYGRGMTMLFHGMPGTGKTATAHAIATAVSKELLEIDFGSLVSSEPGAYERNISQAFQQAKGGKHVLFFDECDGMIQSRAGMGQIMSSMNNAFLKQVEKFEGIVIMATNRIGSLDGALERRLSCIVKFETPGWDERKEIWGKLLPKKLPLHRRVNMEDVYSYALTGGQIKNVILIVARYAAAREEKVVKHDDFTTAIKKVQEASRAFYDKESIARQSSGEIRIARG